MRRITNNLISVAYSLLRMSLLKLCHLKNFKFYFIERFSPNVVFEINKGAKVYLGKKLRVHSGSKIKVRSGAKLVIEDNVKMNYNCIIACHENVYIGTGTEFGPSVYVYDHDHDYRLGLTKNQYKTEAVSIGSNCWIGANSVILRGTEIGNNCVVAAGSVVRGKYPANCMIYQKKETKAKVIVRE